jgi:predicted dehydrogenase
MGAVELALVGAGNRGYLAYGAYALRHPDEARFVAVAEPDDGRRARFADAHGIAPDRRFRSWEDLAARPRLAAGLVNATLDRTHRASTLALLAAGYDILLEKPIAPTVGECVAIVEAAARAGRVLQISHVMRYAPFFMAVRELVRAGRLGELVSVDWRENLAFWHFAHSYVRGNWASTGRAGPMILTKCCHDLDALVWIFGPCERLVSYGSLTRFTRDAVDVAVPDRCTDGCPIEDECPYFAPRTYLARLRENPEGFAVSALTLDKTEDGIMHALRTGPYGRCVYRCDNDAVDHQVVLLRFTSGLDVSMTMQGSSHVEGRTVRIDGKRATLLANESRGEIEVHDHRNGTSETVRVKRGVGGHGGGDEGLMRAFVGSLVGRNEGVRTSAREALESHLLAFAAEESRASGASVELERFRAEADARGDLHSVSR